MVAALAACTGDESSVEPTAETTASGQTNVIAGSSTTLRIAPSSSATPESAARTAFCATASRAVGGEFDFTSDERIAELNDDPSLSPGQRALVTRATADAKRQVLSGSWSNGGCGERDLRNEVHASDDDSVRRARSVVLCPR